MLPNISVVLKTSVLKASPWLGSHIQWRIRSGEMLPPLPTVMEPLLSALGDRSLPSAWYGRIQLPAIRPMEVRHRAVMQQTILNQVSYYDQLWLSCRIENNFFNPLWLKPNHYGSENSAAIAVNTRRAILCDHMIQLSQHRRPLRAETKANVQSDHQSNHQLNGQFNNLHATQNVLSSALSMWQDQVDHTAPQQFVNTAAIGSGLARSSAFLATLRTAIARFGIHQQSAFLPSRYVTPLHQAASTTKGTSHRFPVEVPLYGLFSADITLPKATSDLILSAKSQPQQTRLYRVVAETEAETKTKTKRQPDSHPRHKQNTYKGNLHATQNVLSPTLSMWQDQVDHTAPQQFVNTAAVGSGLARSSAFLATLRTAIARFGTHQQSAFLPSRYVTPLHQVATTTKGTSHRFPIEVPLYGLFSADITLPRATSDLILSTKSQPQQTNLYRMVAETETNRQPDSHPRHKQNTYKGNPHATQNVLSPALSTWQGQVDHTAPQQFANTAAVGSDLAYSSAFLPSRYVTPLHQVASTTKGTSHRFPVEVPLYGLFSVDITLPKATSDLILSAKSQPQQTRLYRMVAETETNRQPDSHPRHKQNIYKGNPHATQNVLSSVLSMWQGQAHQGLLTSLVSARKVCQFGELKQTDPQQLIEHGYGKVQRLLEGIISAHSQAQNNCDMLEQIAQIQDQIQTMAQQFTESYQRTSTTQSSHWKTLLSHLNRLQMQHQQETESHYIVKHSCPSFFDPI